MKPEQSASWGCNLLTPATYQAPVNRCLTGAFIFCPLAGLLTPTRLLLLRQVSVSEKQVLPHSFFNLDVTFNLMDFPGDSVVKNCPANEGGSGSIPGVGRYPGEENGSPLQ